MSRTTFLAVPLLALLLAACSTTRHAEYPPPGEASPQAVVAVASHLVGSPYRYGGTSPAGFDCSGLVQYVYEQVGVSLPRRAADQYRSARKVDVRDVRPGDILFFRISPDKISHVGIYAEKDRFIHAPSGGKRVGYANLKEEYWRTRLVGAGRVL